MAGGTIQNNVNKILGWGGAVSLINGALNMSGGVIQNNLNDSVGQYAWGGGICALYNSTVTMSGGLITDNAAFLGGGIFAAESTVTITGGTISGNSCVLDPSDPETGIGGGICALGGSLAIGENAAVYNNTAETDSDDIYIQEAEVTLAPVGDGWVLSGCGHPITGWFYDEIDARWDADGAKAHVDLYDVASIPDWPITISSSLSLKAAHGALYAVTFDPQGGSAVESQTVSAGGKVSEPAAPTRAGHTFDGWYREPACETIWDFETPVAENTTLYAKWKQTADPSPVEPAAAIYTVEHYRQNPDGSYTKTDADFPLYGEIGSTVAAMLKDYAHYHVNESRSALSGTVVRPTIGPDGQPQYLILQVYYDPDTFTVTYTDGVEGKEVFPDQAAGNLPYGADTPAFEGTPVRSGYRFIGWEPAVAETVTVDVTYIAQWEATYDPPDPVRPGKPEEKPEKGPEGKPELNLADHAAYIIGDDNGNVRPLDYITRAEAATIFFRLLTDESRTLSWSQTNDYSDVDRGDWFNNAVSTLTNAGILTGMPDGAYLPNSCITRAEFAAIAVRFSDAAYSSECPFPDVPKSHWAYEYITSAYELGWMNGVPGGAFEPDRNMTRAEAMALINRVLERAVEEEHLLADMVIWKDNLPGTWYYETVQEATNSHEYVRTDKPVPDHDFYYENWQEIREAPDWAALEKAWSTFNRK